MTKAEYQTKLDDASATVCALLNQLLEQGHDDCALADALFGYGLQLMQKIHGREAVAAHLLAMSLKFGDPHKDPLKRMAQPH